MRTINLISCLFLLGWSQLAACTVPNPLYDPVVDSADLAPAPLLKRRLFVTAATFTGRELSAQGLTGEAICEGAAARAGLSDAGKRWVPWLSTQALAQIDAIERIADHGPWFDLRDELIFEDREALRGLPAAPIQIDEHGEEVPAGEAIWTGAALGGGVSDNLCYDWSAYRVWYANSDKVDGDIGLVGRVDVTWTAAGALPCTRRAHLLCLEQGVSDSRVP